MLVKISYGNKATINTGNYENLSPQYFLSVEIDKKKVSDKEISEQLLRLRILGDSLLQAEIDRIKNPVPQTSSLRTETIDGEKFLHVTSAITPETPDVPHIEEHADLGTSLDSLCKNFIENGIAEPTCEIPKTPNITVTWDSLKSAQMKWFSDNKEAITFSGCSIKGLNSVYRFIGEADAYGTYLGKPAIFDFKKTKNISEVLRTKYFMQMAAYSMFDNLLFGIPEAEVLVICSPFNKPIATEEIAKYKLMFLNRLKETKERYGIK